MTSGTAFHETPVARFDARANLAVQLRRLSADAALLMTVAAVAAIFLLSPLLLEGLGVAYLTSGGGPLAKFHPSTFLAIGALAARALAHRRPPQAATRIFGADGGALLLLVAVVSAMVSAAIILKTPVTPLVDSFLLPIFMFLLLRDLDPKIVRWLAYLVVAILCANAVVGIAEFLHGSHFFKYDVPDNITSDPTRPDANFSWLAQYAQDWRSFAILGHPLANGMIVGMFILCLLAPASNWLPPSIKLPILALQGVSMFTFGARAALALVVALGSLFVVKQATRAVTRGRRITPRQAGIAMLIVALAFGVLAVLSDTSFFDRTLERFAQDGGSAETRVTMFNLLDQVPWHDLLFGPDKDVIATEQRLNGLEFGIESSWLGLTLTYGLIITLAIVVGLATFSWSIIRATGEGSGTVLVFYYILVSGAAALSTKVTSLGVAVVLVFTLLPRSGAAAVVGSRR